jgi:hypothetical protein
MGIGAEAALLRCPIVRRFGDRHRPICGSDCVGEFFECRDELEVLGEGAEYSSGLVSRNRCRVPDGRGAFVGASS